MPINQEELEMLDEVVAGEADFYAGIIALALFRYDTRERVVVRENAGPEVAKLVLGAYKDVQEYYGRE